MSTNKSTDTPPTENPFESAARHTIALNPLVGMRGKDLLGGAQVLFQAMFNEPKVAVEQWMSLMGELTDIAGGKSERKPQAGDKRFVDATWQTSAIHSGLLKAYLAWGNALDGFIDQTSLNDADKARARLITTIFIDALAPTNSLAGNPVAMRKLIDSGGESLWRGLKHFIEDLSKNGGLPSQVDSSAFKVGGNIAISSGSVVVSKTSFWNSFNIRPDPEGCAGVRGITPPQINKFYSMDLSPDKSMVKFLLESRHSDVLRELAQSDCEGARLGARHLCRRRSTRRSDAVRARSRAATTSR